LLYNEQEEKIMITNVNDIRAIVQKHTDFLRDTYHVEKIGVFGSVARGDNADTSDIDVLVEFSEPIGMFKFVKLEEYLSQLIGKKIDLVTKNALKPAIKEDILHEVVYV